MSLRIIEGQYFTIESAFTEEERLEIRTKKYKQLHINLLNKIVKTIYTTIEPIFSGEEANKYVNGLVEWHQDMWRDSNQIHSLEDLETGLADISVVTKEILDILTRRKIISPVDTIHLQHTIDHIISDVKGFKLVQPCTIWHPNQTSSKS